MKETHGLRKVIDPTVASPARMYDYYLGGSADFAADRAAAARSSAASRVSVGRWRHTPVGRVVLET